MSFMDCASSFAVSNLGNLLQLSVFLSLHISLVCSAGLLLEVSSDKIMKVGITYIEVAFVSSAFSKNSLL